jgi:hypothetical protein
MYICKKTINMKNSIFIDVDTEREQPVLIGKPPEITQPENAEEAAKMIINDIGCVCEALCTLIHLADVNSYATKEELIKASITLLNGMLEPLKETPSDETQQDNQ